MLKDRETPKNPMAVANLEIQQVQSCRGGCFSKGVGRGFGDGGNLPGSYTIPLRHWAPVRRKLGPQTSFHPPD